MKDSFVEIKMRDGGDEEPVGFPLRVNRFVALSGVATRREADVLIERGFVLINGKPAVIGQYVREGDTVSIADSVMRRSEHAYLAFNKPAGHDSDTAAGTLRFKPSVRPAGKLDKDDEGLIILTNDARAADLLQHPDTKIVREFVVRTQEGVNEGFLERLARSAEKQGFGRASADLMSGSSFVMRVAATPRQLTKLCESLHHTVLHLKQKRIANVALKGLKPGAFRKLEGDELAGLLRAIGL